MSIADHLGLESHNNCDSCTYHLRFQLLQYALHGPSLENDSPAAMGPKRNIPITGSYKISNVTPLCNLLHRLAIGFQHLSKVLVLSLNVLHSQIDVSLEVFLLTRISQIWAFIPRRIAGVSTSQEVERGHFLSGGPHIMEYIGILTLGNVVKIKLFQWAVVQTVDLELILELITVLCLCQFHEGFFIVLLYYIAVNHLK